MRPRLLRLAGTAGLILGFLSLFSMAIGAVSPPPPCIVSLPPRPGSHVTCTFEYPDGGAPIVLSTAEILALLVGSLFLVVASSIALFYSFKKSHDSLVSPSTLK